MKKCPACKTLNDESAQYCSFCGYSLGDEDTPAPGPQAAAPPARGAPTPAPAEPEIPPAADTVPPSPAAAPATPAGGAPKKSVAMAIIASILFPGLGQTYNGALLKGVLLYLGITLLSLPGYPFILLAGVVYLYTIWDAYHTATRMNKGEIGFVNFSWVSIFLYFVSAVAIAIGAGMILAALAMAADEYFLYTDSCGNIFGCS
ncbi:hypothetical protein AZH53_10085 [Methanomicrobiaceae archaeon CYW5]|uniref:hypothetical protein n=1 Tax=Methanovulcanius yangii TaxID=1789227 RepID=UPI0029C9F0DD|nr:hypothetical protein [Methanovulcanius yangii]MBT8508753.1 hypothetical protein [Methanovulcanius yangii]